MPYDYQAALNRIEDKIDTVDEKLDAHLLSHAEATGRNYWPRKLAGKAGVVFLAALTAFITSHVG